MVGGTLSPERTPAIWHANVWSAQRFDNGARDHDWRICPNRARPESTTPHLTYALRDLGIDSQLSPTWRRPAICGPIGDGDDGKPRVAPRHVSRTAPSDAAIRSPHGR